MSPQADADALVLAADVGGTKTALALAEARDRAEPRFRRRAESAAWPDFETLARDFLAARGRPRLAAIAVAAAGPLDPRAQRIDVTHLPWHLDAARIARALEAPRVALLNDFAATALGMLELPAEAFACVQGDAPRRPGTLALLGAGTGLGEAVVAFEGTRARVLPSEGGQASFAPRTPREIALLQHLAGPRGEHVPVEAVVSGPGLVRIHGFLRAAGGAKVPPRADAAAIAEAGLRGDDPVCVEALELFAACYGAEAGNLALRAQSQGGVWLGGGIAPKLLPALRTPAFLEAFRARGPFTDWLASLPVAVCLADDAALRGALAEARRIAAES
jgi:glucokinase